MDDPNSFFFFFVITIIHFFLLIISLSSCLISLWCWHGSETISLLCPLGRLRMSRREAFIDGEARRTTVRDSGHSASENDHGNVTSTAGSFLSRELNMLTSSYYNHRPMKETRSTASTFTSNLHSVIRRWNATPSWYNEFYFFHFFFCFSFPVL